MGDDYLDRLEKIKEKDDRKKFKKSYRKGFFNPRADFNAVFDRAKELLDSEINIRNVEEVAEVTGAADSLMKYGKDERRNSHLALFGAHLYGKVGRGSRPSVKNRLLKAYEEDPKPALGVYEGIKEFLENPNGKISGGLEKQTLAITSGIGLLIGLFLLSPNITGNAVSNIASVTSNWIGAALFIFGLVGGYFYTQK